MYDDDDDDDADADADESASRALQISMPDLGGVQGVRAAGLKPAK